MVKSLAPEARDKASLARLRGEARMLGLLVGVKGVPRLLHADAAAGVLVQSRAPGVPLRALDPAVLRDPARAVDIASSLAAILEDVHAARIFHGDIDPGNVMVDVDTGEVTLIGFGSAVAQSHVDADFLPSSALARILPFSAPEQTGRVGRAVDYRADFHALGAVVYWALCGRPPFDEPTALAMLHALLTRPPPPPRAVNPLVPDALAAVIGKLLAKRPEQRYQSAAGLRADLRHCARVVGGLAGGVGFAPGTRDRRIKPAQPSRLFGREADLARLRAALHAPSGQRRVALVRGYSGAGKSALVRALFPAITERQGMFAAGKYDQFQRLAPFGGLALALTELAEYGLAETPSRLAELRTQLFDALGSNAAFLASVVPAFAPLLWDDPDRQGAPPTADPAGHVLERMKRCLAAVLGLVRERGAPLVLFIDDLQWADANSLALIEAIASEHSAGSMLLIAAWRDNEVDAAHPITPMLTHLRKSGVELVDVALTGLDAASVGQLVADVLDDAPDAVAPLAGVLHQKTAGNPFFVLQHLRQLFDAGHLRRAKDGWRCDEQALADLAGSDNLVASLLPGLARLPAETRQLAGVCACLGGAFDTELLAAVCEVTPERIDSWLMPLIQSDVLLPARPGPRRDRASVERAARALRFCHDRVQQAARALLTDAERGRWHLAIARTIARGVARGMARGVARTDGDASSPAAAHFAMADHYLAGRAGIEDDAERAFAIGALRTAARGAIASGAFEPALRFVEGASALATTAPARVIDPVDALRLDVLHHAALHGLARHDASDAVFARIEPFIASQPLEVSQAVSRQSGALATRGQYEAAVRLALDCAAALGVAHPAEGEWDQALADELEALYRVLEERGTELFDSLPSLREPELEAAGLLLLYVLPPAIFWRPVVSLWTRLRIIRIGWEHGGFAALGPTLATAILALIDARDDYATGRRLGAAGSRLAQRDGVPALEARARYAMGGFNSHWFEPLERAMEHARHAYRLAVEAGDMLYAGYTYAITQVVLIDTAEHLDEVRAEVATAIGLLEKTGNRHAWGNFVNFRQFVRCMKGETSQPGRFDDAGFDEAAHGSSIANNGVALAHFAIYRSLAAALFGDWRRALVVAREAVPLVPFIIAFYGAAVQRWVHAMALCQALREARAEDAPALRAELEPVAAWLRRRAAEAPMNFGHLSALVDALKAWADGDGLAATRDFEAAIDGALRERRPYQHALACELAGDFHEVQGAARAARAYRAEALKVWRAWGAAGKARQIIRASEGIVEAGAGNVTRLAEVARDAPVDAVAQGAQVARVAKAGEPTEATEDAEDTGNPASLDLSSVVQASHVLAQERDPRALMLALLGLVRQYAAAERGVLFWKDEAGAWQVRGGFEPGRQWVAAPESPAEAAAVGVPASVFQYLARSHKPTLIQDLASHRRFGREAAVRELGIQSVVGLPIHHRGESLGLLYLENRQVATTLDAAQLETLRLIGLQFAIAHDNARVYGQLEALVATRTAELERNRNVLQSILEHSPAIVFVKDMEGRYLRHSPTLADLVGRPGASLLGMRDEQLVDPATAKSLRDEDLTVLRDLRVLRLEQSMPTPRGECSFLTHKFPLFDADGQPYAIGGIAIEITELKRAREASEAANRAKGQFLSNMSHELRTPLNAIIGFADVMRRDRDLPPAHRKHVQIINTSGEHLLALIDTVLDMAKIEAGKIELDPSDIHLAAFLDTLVAMLEMRLRAKNLTLVKAFDPALPAFVRADALRLRQVFLNLLGNASKFTREGGVTLRVRHVAGHADGGKVADPASGEGTLYVEVSDTGPGMSSAEMAGLFTAFQQGEAGRHSQSGTGLGLVISRTFVEMMGGTLRAESALGHGSTFRFHVRTAAARAGVRPSPPALARAGSRADAPSAATPPADGAGPGAGPGSGPAIDPGWADAWRVAVASGDIDRLQALVDKLAPPLDDVRGGLQVMLDEIDLNGLANFRPHAIGHRGADNDNGD